MITASATTSTVARRRLLALVGDTKSQVSRDGKMPGGDSLTTLLADPALLAEVLATLPAEHHDAARAYLTHGTRNPQSEAQGYGSDRHNRRSEH